MHTLTSDLLAVPLVGAGPPDVLARVVLPGQPRALPLYVDGDRPDMPTSGEVLDRRRVRVPAGRRVSFATWFAAFPAGWWAHETDVREVRLDVALTGPGHVELFASDAGGRVRACPVAPHRSPTRTAAGSGSTSSREAATSSSSTPRGWPTPPSPTPAR